ncbi:MAG: hypothetical protein LWX83_17600 [Anaerolineae bacterium]|nr:hypothetical protein [Anaerolineae bacterium]
MDTQEEKDLTIHRQPRQKPRPRRRWLWRYGPAFWTVTGALSLIINIILIVIVFILAGQLFTLKSLVSHQLLDGLSDNFALMDQARIQANIPVSAQVPAKFDLPLETNTVVVLTDNTLIHGASVSLYTGGLTINNAPTDILLPAGTRLPVRLSLTVPVDQQIPVNLDVPVDIALNQTDLHQPFVGLQQVVKPYQVLLNQAPNSWWDVFCAAMPGNICK